MIAEQVLAALLSLAPCYADRNAPEGAKATQLAYVARAVASEAGNVDEAAYLVAIAWHESRLCLDVHAGNVRGPGRGLWQIERASRRVPPFTGLDEVSTRHAAHEALWMVRHSHQCGAGPAAVFTAYAGRACGVKWPTLSARVATWYYVRSLLQ